MKNTASRTAIKTSLEDLSEVETKRKRISTSAKRNNKNKSEGLPEFDTIRIEDSEPAEPECKVESDQDSVFGMVENHADPHYPKDFNEDGESSDSSSNEFEQPDFSQLAMENIQPKEENLDDFAALEDNMLDDIGRLSESEESDFEDVLPLTATLKKEEDVKKSSPPKVKKAQPSPPKSKSQEIKPKNVKRGKRDTKVERKKGPMRETAPKKLSQRSRRKSSIKDANMVDVDKMDISQLLAMGEGVAESCKDKALPAIGDSADSSEEESEDDDWEEVKADGEAKPEEKPHVIPKEGVQITIDAPELFRRKKRKGIDLEACLKRRLNRNKRQIQVLVHKVHLLCWIAHGRYVNYILNSKDLMGFGLSLIPSKHCYPPSRTDLDYLEQIVQWFRKTIPIVQPDKKESYVSLETSLEKQFQSKKANSKKDLVLMFICTLRSLGIKTRLVLSLQPAPIKPPSNELCTVNPRKSTPKSNEELPSIPEETPSTSKESETKGKEKKKSPAGVDKSKKEVRDGRGRGKALSSKQIDSKKSSLTKNEDKTAPRSSRGQRSQRKQSYRDSDSSDYEEEEKKQSSKKSTKGEEAKKQSNKKSPKGKALEKKTASKKTSGEGKREVSQDDDSDFEPEVISVSKGKGIKVDPKNRKVLSSESESENLGNEPKTSKKKEGIDVWAEVFLEMEEKWISVDVPQGKVHCVVELHAKATSPVLYILAFGNDLCLKDVTRRYCPQWLSVTQKKRIEERWWKQTLRPYLPRKDAFDKREEEEMDEELEGRPLPSSISEFKNHPLYVLKRHLLKFEAIYPPDAPSIGFVRGEPVYPRECVHQLHSRETWLKEAKVVRLGEQPYKIVKARPKYDRMSGKVVTDLPLELFGIWQVNDYMPPPAVDGKVPRNEYGNVDLYKPCMLPGGTVHLRLPGLNRVAKKLQIDCVPAVTGFDFHSGGSHPTFDGFIVCEEFKETLIEAWSQEQDEQEKRAREKHDKRVLGNWVRLVRGLLIRESLRKKYSFGEEGESSSGKKKKTTKKKD
ncbi:hypothetical protein J437_LFUL001333 [Ladona fulva]|uniref:Uncharacterized protein n=1 Tax=Ladona fulva TaxID=123851 RepID=A0A8K0JTE4_LADFU|nr:hypothetical protein J437_LFUL001333 [Ladona fulva]